MNDNIRCISAAPGVDWYAGISPEARCELEVSASRRRVAAGQAIFVQGARGDAMYRIISGSVRIRNISPCGREVLMVIYGPGHCIGTVALMDGLPRHNDAIAENSVELETLLAADFHRVAQKYPELYRAIAASYAMWIRDHQTMFVGGLSLEERLARRLDFLLDFGAATPDAHGSLQLDFTQDMLASSVAVSRQAINKLLQEWQDRGVIDYRYGSVVVRDRGELRRLGTSRLN